MILNERTNYNREPGLSYFRDEISSAEHIYRQSKVTKISNHLLGQHDVKQRASEGYMFKGKAFTPSSIILQGIKSVINFHTAYLVGNPVTITGTPSAVEVMNTVYRKGMYSKTDWQILADLMTYGNAFEYVYIDDDGTIRSRVIRNTDSYPIYDDAGEYKYFVEHWREKANGNEHYVIYYKTHIDTYINNRMIAHKTNLTGLPIHYTTMDKDKYDIFGASPVLDLIPIQDAIEGLLSKLYDGISVLSTSPLGILTGNKISEDGLINSNIAGAVLNVDEGCTFTYANATMDYQTIKLELDNLYQHFSLVAAVPSNVLGASNIANVSEESLSFIYNLTENKGKQNMYSLLEGFRQRWDYMRKLLALTGQMISDDDFDSLNVSYNISKPIDTKQNMDNMKQQYDMGAISKTTIMEKSPYTTDSAQEMQRLAAEGKDINAEQA